MQESTFGTELNSKVGRVNALLFLFFEDYVEKKRDPSKTIVSRLEGYTCITSKFTKED